MNSIPSTLPRHPDAGKVTVSTWEYLKTHGKEPRGRGMWAFEPLSPVAGRTAWFVHGPQTYAAARRLACSYFAALGIFEITVST